MNEVYLFTCSDDPRFFDHTFREWYDTHESADEALVKYVNDECECNKFLSKKDEWKFREELTEQLKIIKFVKDWEL